MTTCVHDNVSRADYVHNRPFWKCDKCNVEFALHERYRRADQTDERKTMTRKKTCIHDMVHTVVGAEQGTRWECADCTTEFVPVASLGAAAAAIAEGRIDDIVAVASAMMWDFHERAVEKYGKDSDEASALRPGHDAPEEDGDCETEGHLFKDGACVRPDCGVPLFLGRE